MLFARRVFDDAVLRLGHRIDDQLTDPKEKGGQVGSNGMGVLEGGEGSTMQRIPMLRDDAGKGGGRRNEPKNVLGDRLEVCSLSPMTGFLRDGCCDTSREDIGSHTVCAVMTAGFLSIRSPAVMISQRRSRNSAFRD
jgi:hypothetical protein